MMRRKGGIFLELCDTAVIRALLERHGFHFSKAKGQNFLTDRSVPERIAEMSGVDASCGVLEVGPGIGCLTQELCRRAGHVAAVEVDERLRPVLSETMADFSNLSLVFADILKTDIPALVARELGGLRPVACANLPYYITTPVLAALLESRCFTRVTVMVQKEVAQRICAAAGTPEYGAFSVFCRYYAEPELLFDVPPSCFVPQPKVTSAVLTLAVRTDPPCEILSEEMFFRVVRAAFAQRRKTLVNCLAASFPQGKQALAELLAGLGIAPTVRGETLELTQFAAIANALCREA